MLGGALAHELKSRGAPVTRLGRGPHADVPWDALRDEVDPAVVDGARAVVHLAGAPIGQRWTSQAVREIRDSRVRGTAAIARAVADAARPPSVFISASAVGIYGDRGDEELTESSEPGADMLSGVARQWEAVTELAASAGVRVVTMRTGVVLSRTGGALARLLPFFRLGLGGRIGNGRQWMSWISLHDAVRAIRFAIATPLRGPVNVVAPNPVTNAEFTRALGAVLRRPAILPVPRFLLTLVFGEMARGTILCSQRATPAALMRAGFTFDDQLIEGGLRRALTPGH